jgi:hypothetical protein
MIINKIYYYQLKKSTKIRFYQQLTKKVKYYYFQLHIN